MFVIGLLLMGAGVVAILLALFATTSGAVTFVGADLDPTTVFLLGLVSGLAILWGFAIAKTGARRSLRRRRERRRLSELSDEPRTAEVAEANRRGERRDDSR